MPKQPSGSSSRRPPEPSEDHAEIDDWMGRQVPDLQPIVEHLDATIRDVHPDAHFALKWKKAYYGLPDVGWMIELVAYDVSVNIVFHGGADLDPPPDQGSGSSRYVKLRSLEEAQDPQLRRWIEQAGEVKGWT
ncbi:DUF1801 domain-containing protein [Actinomarinicola tropica]|uniref:YdhG-like domain-containing protein n=1 Tax=Actinomarinicola tropica TaxID=2789776 RepID=A0A5Q2RUG2_9ACTN|nr:DUF1801 domain-containing protein [Actinomarinicola tropica]QGG96855.1 hypothetical protein GH723_18095 [Actinomarinicola tropica]